jgi:hypothetical protein
VGVVVVVVGVLVVTAEGERVRLSAIMCVFSHSVSNAEKEK